MRKWVNIVSIKINLVFFYFAEERMMLEDAKGWLNAKRFGDKAHEKTGATALHVAAAKGYIKASFFLRSSFFPNCIKQIRR